MVPVVEQTAPDATHAQYAGKDETEHLQRIVPHERSLLNIDAGHEIKSPKRIDQHHSHQHQIPVAQQLDTKDSTQIVFAGKLLKDAGRCALERVLEVHRVCQTNGDGHHINHHIHPFAHLVVGHILLPVQRKQHQQDVQRVGVHDARRVEHDTAPKEPQEMSLAHAFGEVAVVFQQILHPCKGIGGIHQQDIDGNRQKRREYGMLQMEPLDTCKHKQMVIVQRANVQIIFQIYSLCRKNMCTEIRHTENAGMAIALAKHGV